MSAAIARRLAGYPGRGLFALRAAKADETLFGYFVTGRSSASRARRAMWDGTRMSIVSADGHSERDPLRHYTAAIDRGSSFLIGNGEQVSHLDDEMARGTEFAASGTGLRFEPDPPIFTPRITLNVGVDASLAFVSHRAFVGGIDPVAERRYFSVDAPQRGEIYVMTTYDGLIDQPRASGTLEILHGAPRDLESAPQAIWRALDPDLRVLLVAFSMVGGRVAKVAEFGAVVSG